MDESTLPPDIVEQLSKFAKAQEDANRIEQSKLNIERRRETEALEIIASTQHLSQDVRLLTHEIRLLLDYVQSYTLKDDALRDLFESLSERIERLERNQVLLLTENNPQKRTEAIDELEQELATRKELKRRQRNLNKLQEKAASYGSMDVPLQLQNAIEAEECRITELENKL